MKTKEAITAIKSRLEDPDSEVRMMAVASLGELLEGKSSPPALVRKLQDSDELVRIEAAESLGAIGDKRALRALWRSIEDKSPLVRSYLAGAIGELGSTKDIAKLEDRLRKEKSDTAKVGYCQALYKLGKRDVLDQLLHMPHIVKTIEYAALSLKYYLTSATTKIALSSRLRFRRHSSWSQLRPRRVRFDLVFEISSNDFGNRNQSPRRNVFRSADRFRDSRDRISDPLWI